MKVNVGDTVRFMNDVGEGKVTKVLKNDTALVLNSDGFEYPVLMDELVVIKDIKINYSDKKEIQKPAELPRPPVVEPVYTGKADVNIYLAYLPKNQNLLADSDLDVYLINDSDYFVSYNFLKQTETGKYKSLTGTLEPNFKEKIQTLLHDTINQDVDVTLQIIFFDKKEHKLREPLSTHNKIKDVKFYKESSFCDNDFFKQKALIIPMYEEHAMTEVVKKLTPDEILNAIQENSKSAELNKPKQAVKVEKNKIREVDLHITELLETEVGMTDKEKLDYQMDAFRAEMKAAIKEKHSRIVFIHGVGNGTLKLEIRRELHRLYPHFPFQDASFREYGYGATMVILSKS